MARPSVRSGRLGPAQGHILEEVRRRLDALPPPVVERFIREMDGARRVFVYGAGRSGLVARAFAIRLAHLGYTVYVIGETVAAPVQKGDVVVLVSGTGETYPVVMSAEIAKDIGARTVVITGNPRSSLASFGDIVVPIEGGHDAELAPLGTLFEATSWVLLDSVVAELMQRRRQTEHMLRQRHATME